MSHRVVVVGAGVVGQATGKGLLKLGHSVIFADINEDIVQSLKDQGYTSYTIDELAGQEEKADVTMLTVSTPTDGDEINLSYIAAAAESLGERLRNRDSYHVVVVRSTVPPGTTEELIIPAIEKASGKKAGRDFGVCMNPEYLREAEAEKDFAEPWLTVVGQLDEKSGDLLAEIYQDVSCPLHRVGLREAEMQKYVHNLFNAVKIGYFNELRQICQQAGVDADSVFKLVTMSAEGMWNPEYGTRDFGPFDGMCLPKDTQAFLAWARKKGWSMPLLATAINNNNQLLAEQVKTKPAAAVRVSNQSVIRA